MKKFMNRFSAICVMFVLAVGLMTVNISHTEAQTKKKCNNAYSLHKALSSAQDTATPYIPIGLPGATQSKNIQAESAITGFAGLIQRFINGLTGIAAALAIFFIVFNGGGMMLAAGDTEKIKKARQGCIWALIGLLVIMFSYVIAKTAISLTYSGADEISQQQKNNVFDEDCDDGTHTPPVTPETQTEEVPESTACTVPRPPTSCFDSNPGSSVQSRNGEACTQADFDPICLEMGLGAGCPVAAIQGELQKGSHYANPDDACSQADNLYGQCTQAALEDYLSKKCEGTAS